MTKTKEKKESNDYGEVFFNWKFSEFTKHERGKYWYVLGSLVVVILLFFSLITANMLFAFITIIAALMILMFQRSDNEIDFSITEDGILLNEKFYDYKEIDNFYFFYQPPEVKTLYFELKGFFSPRIPISLEDQNPVKIRETLLEYIEEDLDRDNEPVSDQTSRMFKL